LLPTLSHDYEVIIVNDGSTDRTSLIADELERDSPFVSVVHHARNAGYGFALRSGFAHASKELIFYTDGDGQYDTGDLPKLWERLTDDIDVVNGFKLKRADTATRRILGGVYNQFVHLLFRLPVRDVDCDFRLIRRERMQQIELASASGAICVELIAKLQRAGCRFDEVGVHHLPRTNGRSQFFTVRRIIATMIELVGLRFHLSQPPAAERAHS
jgi:glycosyltransferase involved in cell wall biosynthesis